MAWRTILAAFAATAFASSATWAQAPAQPKDEDPSQNVPQKIREKLTADGYEDIKVAPGSYIVSAKDKSGQRVVMVISPTQTTMMKIPDTPSQAQMPPADKDEIIQQ